MSSDSTLRRSVLVSLAGSAIEWYDFFVYASATALVFTKLFFPASDPFAATLLAFSTFAVGFVVRPIGAAVFGHFGDRVGRKPALVTAMLTMGVATTAVGLLPPYASIGAAAPILLVVLRLVQGLALGGQWGGAVLLVTEAAPASRRGFYGSFAQLGVPIALILSNVVFLVASATLSEDAFLTWGWRVPFLLSILLVGVALYAQSRVEEQAPDRSRRGGRAPLVELLRRYPRQILLAAGATMVGGTSYYLLAVYLVSYATGPLHQSRGTVLIGVLVSAVVCALVMPAAAAWSDVVGRRRVFLLGAGLLAAWAFPLFRLVESGSPVLIGLGLVVGQAFFAMTYGPAPALFAELFGARVRYTGISLGYQIGSVLGGAFAPIIATTLLAGTNWSGSIALYLIAVCALSFVAVWFAPRRPEPGAAARVLVASPSAEDLSR
ncbi:MFS transporter [Amycolatopsis rhabdoformis]|uniref:MFS transporter n=1 Tax=Amycolatopsis rhabdoformis TaxID=1448059 RepID=A0ABZ1HV30_9PSEU|nr:MFS transporter [Amycolatopsis rhabdoformis]WSE26187.1 MFS transporter [Amycolatopsis rhabdoformis]